MTDVTFEASVLWLETRSRASGTATLTYSFFGRSPWLHGQQVKRVTHFVVDMFEPIIFQITTVLFWIRWENFNSLTTRVGPLFLPITVRTCNILDCWFNCDSFCCRYVWTQHLPDNNHSLVNKVRKLELVNHKRWAIIFTYYCTNLQYIGLLV